MGIFKKIKDIFYDEEIVEVPVKEEKKKKTTSEEKNNPPKIESIIEKEEVENTFSERELFKPEKTFDFPVFDTEDEEEIKPRSRTNILEIQKELERNLENPSRLETRTTSVNDSKREAPTIKPIITEKQGTSSFRPTPVISPIYGILDKNYTKEEVVERKEIHRPSKSKNTYDYVRRKAYGTLEDELENTLTRVNNEIVDSVNEIESELENLPKPTKNIEDLLSEIDKNANTSIGELEEAAKDKMMEEEETGELYIEEDPVEEKKEDTVNDNTLEHDLFNLIDSMYEDKEE